MQHKGLMFPNKQNKKRRMHHPKSILHNKDNRTCYICMHHGDYSIKPDLHEHHIFNGPNRAKSEEYGVKVYLCPECHMYGPHAVHRDPAGEENTWLKQRGQQAFEAIYGHNKFMEIFGKNQLGEEEDEKI